MQPMHHTFLLPQTALSLAAECLGPDLFVQTLSKQVQASSSTAHHLMTLAMLEARGNVHQ